MRIDLHEVVLAPVQCGRQMARVGWPLCICKGDCDGPYVVPPWQPYVQKVYAVILLAVRQISNPGVCAPIELTKLGFLTSLRLASFRPGKSCRLLEPQEADQGTTSEVTHVKGHAWEKVSMWVMLCTCVPAGFMELIDLLH